jgi:hypothetical protein
MGVISVYVLHPDRGEADNKISEHVQSELSRFALENTNMEFWFDRIVVWRNWFHRSDTPDFVQFLLNDGFIDATHLFVKGGDPATLAKLNDCDVAGFFIRDQRTGEPIKAWQLLKPLGRFDYIRDETSRFKPLLTKSRRAVQSCLVSNLNRKTTPAPDAYVYCGNWIAEHWFDPITSEQCGWTADQSNNESFEEQFWETIETLSPNTRVTAVSCHV